MLSKFLKFLRSGLQAHAHRMFKAGDAIHFASYIEAEIGTPFHILYRSRQ
jgi:hypothetical protein